MKKQESAKKPRVGRRADNILLLAAVILVLGLIVLNGSLFLGMINQQTDLLGHEQLDKVSNRLQLMLRNSEITLRQFAAETDNMLKNGCTRDELMAKYNKLREDPAYSGCKNIYTAGETWHVIPGFNEPESGFDASERVWYQGARKKGAGKAFISSPYLDVVTGSMCFTVSILLDDGDTVVGVDFDLDELQDCVSEIAENGGDALIVNSSGQIVAYRDNITVGGKLGEMLPQYAPVFTRIMSSSEVSSFFDAKISGTDSKVFYSCTANEWYLISTVSNSVLYGDSLVALIRNSLLYLLFVVILLVAEAANNRRHQREARDIEKREEYISGLTDELRSPIRTILGYTEQTDGEQNEEKRAIRDAAVALDKLVTGVSRDRALAGGTAQRTAGRNRYAAATNEISTRRNKFVMVGVVAVLTVTMAVAVILSSDSLMTSGNYRMRGELNSYTNELETWITEQKSTMDMFAKSISVNPSLMEDYEGAVKWLNDITKQYDDISVTYMANPEWEHTVIMNNHWEPAAYWHVEDRQWYIDTVNSDNEDGFNVSAPYYDEQTGLYCVTFSERVYDVHGNFIGIFAADFYLDKLTTILSESYTDTGYAFLADRNGDIINHPDKQYELSADNSVNIDQIGFGDVIYSDTTTFITDYDGKRKAVLAAREKVSDIYIICVEDWDRFFGDIVRYNFIYLIVFGICIGIIIYILSRQMKLQKQSVAMLRESAEIAENAGRAKSDFLAHMSHEIRTPINAVLGMNEMIMRESSDSSVQLYSENIRKAGRTLLTLINSILDFSKIEDGKMEIVPVNYDTAEMVNDLVNLIRERASGKGLMFVTEIDPELPRSMYGDDVRIRQVITNLLTNAVKYTDQGTVSLRMRVQSADQGSIVMHVEVEDTGIGIKTEDIENLFQSFRRLDLEKNRNVEGTGLGISIVRSLLFLMKSELKVSSSYGEGSRFSFDIIQGVVDPQGIGDYTKRLAESRHSANDGMYIYAPDANILVIDDNNMNLLVAKGLLKRSGAHVDIALSGDEGIDLVSRNYYDIIFLDHMMPGLDGLETLKIMKERDLITAGTSVIMMTANALLGAREEYMREGFDDYLSKPIDVDQMEKLLAQYIPDNKYSYKMSDGSTASAAAATNAPKASPTEIRRASRYNKLKLIPDLDIEAGMRYCMNDETYYVEMVRAYLGNNILDEIEEYYDSDDTGQYENAMRRLMFDSRCIGALGIYASSKKICAAIASGDIRVMRQEHRDMIKNYRRLLSSLSNAMK